MNGLAECKKCKTLYKFVMVDGIIPPCPACKEISADKEIDSKLAKTRGAYKEYERDFPLNDPRD